MNTIDPIKFVAESLGEYSNGGDEIQFHCPHCKHHKKKLSLNKFTYKWRCWVCNHGGLSIYSLLKWIGDSEVRLQIAKSFSSHEEVNVVHDLVSLPSEFKPLWKSNPNNPDWVNAISYLNSRGIDSYDIVNYELGYCDSGKYQGRIIIPSYGENLSLNFFIGRTYLKWNKLSYLGPKNSKEFVGFESFVNWNEPVILVEGPFDAIRVKQNSIPLFGKYLNNFVKFKLIEKGVKRVYIALDSDAMKDSLKIISQLIKYGIETYQVPLPLNQDPADLGYHNFQRLLQTKSYLVTEYDLLKMRINA